MGELRPATVFSSVRLMGFVFGHLGLAMVLCLVYAFIDVDSGDRKGFLDGVKDFADLCVTGIVFLLGGSLGMFECLVMILSIGLSVDYDVHITYTYAMPVEHRTSTRDAATPSAALILRASWLPHCGQALLLDRERHAQGEDHRGAVRRGHLHPRRRGDDDGRGAPHS